MANNDKENKIKKFTKEAIGKTLNQFNKEIGIADLVEVNKNQDRILNGILSQVNDENTEKTEKSNIITLDNSTDGIVELKEIQGDTNVNVSKIEEMPITHDIGDKEGNVFTLNEIPKGAISIGEIQGNTMVNCNKDDKKELVLMKDLATQGDNNITLTEGVDGGLVDVALEGNTLVNVSKTKNNYITHEREEDTTGNHIALADEGYIRPVLNGKTMVNVCDQKDSTAVTKSYTVENSGNHVALQGDVDGNCRPIVTGNTLVNLTAQYSFTSRTYINIPCKQNTIYTILNISDYNIGVYNADASICYVNYSPDNKLNFTTNSTDTLFRIYGKTVDGELKDLDYWINSLVILEGDYTDKPIPDYFEGLQSSFEDKLVTQEMVDNGEEEADNLGKYRVDYKVTGKNKCRIDTFSMPSDTYYITLQTQFKEWCPNLIAGKKYKMLYDYSYSEADTEGMVGFAVITNDLINLSTFVYTEEIGSKYIYVYGGHKQGVFSNIRCIEYDSADDSYEPYKGHTKTLYLNSPLLEGDTIEEINGKAIHVHRYGTMNLYDCHKNNYTVWHSDGVTNGINWFWSNTLHESKLGTYITLTDNTFSDKIAYIRQGNAINIGFPEGILSSNDDAGVKAWIRVNNPNVVYKLKTPKYEIISEDSIVCDSYTNGHLDFSTAIPIGKIEFKNTILENKYLYTNTEYTIQFEADKEGRVVISLGGTTLAEVSIVKGLNKISITTPETLTNNNLVLEGIGFNISDIVVTPTTEQDFGYFSGLSSTFESELVTQEMIDSGEEEIGNLGKYRVNYYISGKPQRFGKGGRI